MTSEIRANTLKNRVGLGTVSFTNTGPVVSGIVTIANSTSEGVRLEDNAGVGNSLKITTPTGYVSIGSGNSTFVHLQTDRGIFYFNRRISVDEGIISSYDEDLVLQSPMNTNRMTINKTTGLVSIVNDVDVDGHTNLDNVSIAGITTVNGGFIFDNGTNAGKDLQWQPSNNRLAFFNDVKATFGNTVDLQIYNNSTENHIYGSTSKPVIFSTNTNERFRIDSGGNVTVNKGNATANATLILSKGATGYAKLEFDEVNTQRAYIELDASEDLVHYGAANVEQKFYAGGGHRMTIGTGGDIAIGNHTPDGQLSIRAANASFPRLVISNTDYDENINLSTYHDANGIYAFLGANSKLDSSGNITRDTSGHRSSGIFFDARNRGSIEFYTGEASGNPTEKLMFPKPVLTL